VGSVDLDDVMFDVESVAGGAWVPGPYGPGDQLGSFNEVTPAVTSRALARLDLTRPVTTYHLGEEMFPGFPAWGDREYSQRLVVTGYQPDDDFAGELTDVAPQGRGKSSVHEERVSTTYNMGTKVNGLHHVGVAGMFYNGLRGRDIARSWGTTHLGAETMVPIVTRGVLVDVVGHHASQGADTVVAAPTGDPMLRPAYRITVEDIEAALAWAGVAEPIGPGDVVLIRTGWRALIASDPERSLRGGPPGVYLRECRWLAARRPALVGSDTWCFEVIDPTLSDGHLVPCHQELGMRFGIRIIEAVRTDDLARDGVHDFVFAFNPLRARGAVASSAPPLALGQT
jgi:kynurenine formamidase